MYALGGIHEADGATKLLTKIATCTVCTCRDVNNYSCTLQGHTPTVIS